MGGATPHPARGGSFRSPRRSRPSPPPGPDRPLTHSWKRCQFSIVHKGSRTLDYSPAGGAWTARFGPEFHRFWGFFRPRGAFGRPRGVSNRRAEREAWAPFIQEWRQFRQFCQFCTPGCPARPRRAPYLSLPSGGEAWGDPPSGRRSGPPTGAAGSSYALSKAARSRTASPAAGSRLPMFGGPDRRTLYLLRQDHRSRLRPRPRRRLHRAAAGGGAGHGVAVGGFASATYSGFSVQSERRTFTLHGLVVC